MERNGVVEEELRGDFEHRWDGIPGEVAREAACDISEQEGNVVGHGTGEDSGQSGERVVHAGSDALDGAIGDDEDGTDKVEVLLNLGHDAFLVDLVFLKPTSVGQSGYIEDANLRKR